MERRFIKSGIPGLDEVLGGGLLASSITTLGGPTGSGKSTFAMQFLYNGAIKYGEPGLYIAIEESRDSMLFHMSGYVWDIEKAETERKIIFLDYPVYEVDQFMDQYGAIQEIIKSAGVKRAVVDSIMPLAMYFKNEDDRKKGFLKLIDNIRRWETTTLVISEDTKPGGFEDLPITRYEIESFTDGWINIYYHYDDKKGERVRSVEVLKMKGTKHSARPYPAVIGDEGFNVMSLKTPPVIPPAKSMAPKEGTAVAKPAPKPAARPLPKVPLRELPKKGRVLGIRKGQ